MFFFIVSPERFAWTTPVGAGVAHTNAIFGFPSFVMNIGCDVARTMLGPVISAEFSLLLSQR